MTEPGAARILSDMWDAFGKRHEERRDRRADGEDELRLFPIVDRDLCYPVAALLARGRLEAAGRLVPGRAWVASPPLYG